MRWSPAARRCVIIGAACIATIIGTATAATAHVEVAADKTQAGATNVTVTFTGEAESTTAGIASEQVVLPAGITPQQVRLAKAPGGWTLTPTADGFTVAGAALPVGTDAEFSVLIDKLPADAAELAFKTIETYGDGQIVRWIEIPKPGEAEPANPAPMLKLTGAVPVASTAPATSQAAEATTQPAPSATVAAPVTDDGGSNVAWIVVGAVVVVAAVAAAVIARRRRAETSS